MAFNGITLYNFRGVNGVDTPIFGSLEAQENYFGYIPHLEIESSYYPPLFDNTLTLSADYFNWGDNANPNKNVWNYLSLQSAQGKTFYYFINDITYVSEDMVSVTIRMDTIQSYMFEMRLSRAFISRKAIRRWNKDGTINREFVRENLSTGEMVLKNVDSNQEKITDKGIYWFLVKTSDTLVDDTKTYWAKNFNGDTGVHWTELGKYEVNGTSVQFSSYCYLVPVGTMPIFLKDPSGGEKNYGILGNDFIQFLAKDSRVQSITLINPTAISNLIQYDFYTPSGLNAEVCELSISDIRTADQQAVYKPLGLFGKFSQGDATALCGFYFTIRDFSVKAPTISDFFGQNSFSLLKFVVEDRNLDITQNTKAYMTFSPSFVPCMVDEQYYGVALRYQGQEIFPPYHYATSPRYIAYVTSDLEGNSYANVEISTNFKATSGANQGYLGACASFGAVQLPLYTDPWRDYKVGHQGSYITDWVASALGGLGTMSKAVGSGILIAESATRSSDYAQNYQQRMQAIQAQAKGLGQMSSTLGEYITGFNTLIEKMPKSNIMRDAKTGRFVKVV